MKHNTLSISIIVLCLTVIVLAVVKLCGLWDNAIYVFEPLTAVIILLEGVQSWKKNRSVAVACFAAAAIILAIALYIFLR